jgi:hypothetical protein
MRRTFIKDDFFAPILSTIIPIPIPPTISPTPNPHITIIADLKLSLKSALIVLVGILLKTIGTIRPV